MRYSLLSPKQNIAEQMITKATVYQIRYSKSSLVRTNKKSKSEEKNDKINFNQ